MFFLHLLPQVLASGSNPALALREHSWEAFIPALQETTRKEKNKGPPELVTSQAKDGGKPYK